MEAEPPPPSKRPAKLKIGTVGAAEVVVASEVDAAGRRKTGVEQDEQLILFFF